MSRGGSYGGGQSSLGYLFGSDDQSPNPPPVSAQQINKSPINDEKVAVVTAVPTPKKTVSNNYHRADGQNSGNFITERPSTKVHSVPGGDSSLGYLFGDK